MTKEQKVELKNMPYTVVSHTTVGIPKLSIVLTAEGIKELAKRTDNGDMVKITEWSDYSDECKKSMHYGKIEILKQQK